MNLVNSRNGSAMMTAPKHCLGIIIIIIIIIINFVNNRLVGMHGPGRAETRQARVVSN